ncbi:hypothetical protein DSO57_1013200 [Entomophthora muscae]|uniref:Uncharacterized protein n=1 Tax=Entomophthora muscae TaxID=34485 RepID=A0ACC2S7I3_9FUNG|nr:hypothetical protein DSO57_1013200 [Entomophthora muscae]
MRVTSIFVFLAAFVVGAPVDSNISLQDTPAGGNEDMSVGTDPLCGPTGEQCLRASFGDSDMRQAGGSFVIADIIDMTKNRASSAIRSIKSFMINKAFRSGRS